MEGAMRTIHIHRILGVAAILATIGQFLIDLRDKIPTGSEAPAAPRLTKPACDWTVYETVMSRMRAEPTPADAGRFALLGEDPYFTYFYDRATGRGVCVVQTKPTGPLVEASRSEAPDETRRTVILVCVLVIISSGTGIQIIRVIRKDAQ
jgi:hypothetical protein